MCRYDSVFCNLNFSHYFLFILLQSINISHFHLITSFEIQSEITLGAFLLQLTRYKFSICWNQYSKRINFMSMHFYTQSATIPIIIIKLTDMALEIATL